jgi:hypothetical protein
MFVNDLFLKIYLSVEFWGFKAWRGVLGWGQVLVSGLFLF